MTIQTAALGDTRHNTEQVYRDHHEWLHGWLWRRLHCPERAADFAHETFFRLLTRRSPERIGQPRAFLVRTAIRLVIDDRRRARLEQAWLEIAAAQADIAGAMPSSEQRAELIEALERIADALEALPEKPRRAFILFRLEGRSQAEIAAELGVSVSMVKKYIARALLHCHHCLSA